MQSQATSSNKTRSMCKKTFLISVLKCFKHHIPLTPWKTTQKSNMETQKPNAKAFWVAASCGEILAA
jgi:hypothetical protein